MAPRPAYGPDEAQWESHRSELTRLYGHENQPLTKVMEHMEITYGFVAKPNQYRKYLTDKWGVHKNTTSKTWTELSRRIDGPAQEYKIAIHGRSVTAAKIRKNTSRYRPTSHRRPNPALARELPPSVVIQKVPPTLALNFTVELPFHNFESSLGSTLQIQPQALGDHYGAPAGKFVTRVPHDTTWYPNKHIMETLQTVVPRGPYPNVSPNFPLMSPASQLFTSPLHRAIIFSLSNNYAGAGALPKDSLLKCLRQETGINLLRMIHSMAEFYTTQAIFSNLFEASIKAGDARLVDLLLKSPVFGIQVNDFIGFLTPISMAAEEGHKDVVRVLLAHGADVNLYKNSFPYGALDTFIHGWRQLREDHTKPELDMELLSMLVEAGAKSTSPDILGLIAFSPQCGSRIRLILEKNVMSSGQHWATPSNLTSIFRTQDSVTCLQVLMAMKADNIDFNQSLKETVHAYDRMIDICASRGKLPLVEFLLKNGAKSTRNTLVHAVSSEDPAIVELLFGHGAKAYEEIPEYKYPNISPFSAAIRSGNPQIIKLVVTHYDLVEPRNKDSFDQTKTLSIADIARDEPLIDGIDITDQYGLEGALVIALESHQNELALTLANAALGPFNEQTLLRALKRRNAVLVRLLLDVGFYFDNANVWDEVVVLAVEWRDTHIVRDILMQTLGGRRHLPGYLFSGVISAIQCKDKAMLDLLLDYGFDINGRHRDNQEHCSPLNVAVQTGDINFVDFVLARGADPHDMVAFKSSMKDKELFGHLIRKHATRYPNGRRDWEPELLMKAIDDDAYDIFERILERGANPFIVSDIIRNQRSDCMSLFAHAIITSKMIGCRYVELLLEQQEKTKCHMMSPVSCCHIAVSASPNSTTVQVRTAFETAIRTCHRPTIELFLRYGANVNFPASHGIKRTPLQAAVETGDIEIIKLLLSFDADVNGPAARNAGATALQIAAIHGHIPIAVLLMEHRADIHASAAQIHGRMPLEGAAENGRLDMVAFLLAAGAGRKGEDKEQFERAIALAKDLGFPYIADMLNRYLEDGEIHMGSKSPFEEFVDYDGVAGG